MRPRKEAFSAKAIKHDRSTSDRREEGNDQRNRERRQRAEV
jgi:hypothetical protein